MLNFRHALEKTSGQMVEKIPIDNIKPNPYQPRKHFTEQSLEELSNSIKEYGVINPITVKKAGKSGYEIVSGERRLRATKMAGLKHIPAIVISALEEDSAIIALIENLQREDLHFMEEAIGYYNIISEHNLTQEQMAKKIGKKQSTIANKLRLLKLSQTAKSIIVENSLTERHARALLKISDESEQINILRQIIKKQMNVIQTEAYIQSKIDYYSSDVKSIEGKRTFIKAYRDVRILINTIKSAVKDMKDAGLKANYYQEDKGENLQVVITIPKKTKLYVYEDVRGNTKLPV